jgi:hypothetical protein
MAASADDWHHGGWQGYHHKGGNGAAVGAAIAGGIIGLGLGAAIASNPYNYAPPPSYYAPPPSYYAPPPGVYYGNPYPYGYYAPPPGVYYGY